MRAISPAALTKSPRLTLDRPRRASYRAETRRSLSRSGGSDVPRRACFIRANISTSKIQRVRTAARTVLRNWGVTRNSLAPHCVSNTRKPRASEAVLANRRPEPVAQRPALDGVAQQPHPGADHQLDLRLAVEHAAERFDVGQRRRQVGVPEADVVGADRKASSMPWRTASALPPFLSQVQEAETARVIAAADARAVPAFRRGCRR